MSARDVILYTALAALGAAVPARGAEPADIGGRLELLVDRYLIDKLGGNAELRLHGPTPREVVMVHDKPWEGNTCGYHTILRDGDTYRMYYRGWHHNGKKEAHPAVVCRAESTDGISWTRPDLDLVEFEGSKKNNIVWSGRGSHNFVPFVDRNPKCSPDGKYKAQGGTHREGGIFAFRSADGIRWELMRKKPIITSRTFAFDSQNIAFWDEVRSEYRVYLRHWRGGHPKGLRDIMTATSKDFVEWTEPAFLEYPGAPPQHLYTSSIQPYHRAPHIFVGFPSRYIPERGSLVEGLFMTSRDGRTFRRWEEAIIRPGRNRDRWYNRSNYIWCGLVETESDVPGGGTELSVYSNERYYKGPGGKTRRYTYRVDGFVSVHAPFEGGSMLTKPLKFSGSKLVLNISTSAAGSVRVEIRDAGGKALPGFATTDCPPIFGDDVALAVEWKKGRSVKHLAARPIRLFFDLKDADLFAFRFAE